MAFSERLKMVCGQIIPDDFMADIGTDHAYVPIFAVKNGIMKRVIAADISRGSCDKAAANVNMNGLADCIDIRCGNGLDVIKHGEQPDCLLISGMGGMLAIEIMEKGIDIVKSLKQLVLQPQRDIDKVRRFVISNGFKIIDEDMIFEDGKYYTVINAVPGKEDTYTDAEYYFGRILIEKKSQVLKEYCIFENNKMIRAVKNIERSAAANAEERKKELLYMHNLYEEVLKCL